MKVFLIMMIATWGIVLSYTIASLICGRFKLGKISMAWLKFFGFMIVVSVAAEIIIFPFVEYFRPYNSNVWWANAGGIAGLSSGTLVYMFFMNRKV